VTTIPPPMFSFPLGDGVVLVPRIPALADAYHDLLAASPDRLARWEPWADAPPVALGDARPSRQARVTGWPARNRRW